MAHLNRVQEIYVSPQGLIDVYRSIDNQLYRPTSIFEELYRRSAVYGHIGVLLLPDG
jgi:hypothetical protein